MRRLVPYGWLLFIGISWGATQPLTKIAVSSGYQPLGLIFWQMSISAVVLGLVNMIRRRPLPINRRVVPFYLAIALIGTIIPNAASYKAYTVLPAGIMALLLSLIPMIAFPIALMFGLDQGRGDHSHISNAPNMQRIDPLSAAIGQRPRDRRSDDRGPQ